MEAKKFIDRLFKYEMIDKKTVHDSRKLKFIKEVFAKMNGNYIDESDFMRRLNKKLFPVMEFESNEYMPFPENEYGCYCDNTEINSDMRNLSDVVKELMRYDNIYVENNGFKHLIIDNVSEDGNEWMMTMFMRHPDYRDEEYEIKLKMNRISGNKFNVVVLDWNRCN